MPGEEFDKALEAKVPPHYLPIVAELRKLMRECAPDADEVALYGSPAWKGRKPLAIISVSKTHLTFAFDRGAEFDNAHNLLEGAGKRTRHIKIKTLDALDHDAVRNYITQAATLDAQQEGQR